MTKIAEEFRNLHKKGKPLILANAWDAGSARLLVAKGAKAVATSSAAHAFTLGRSDMGQVTREESLAHARDLILAVNVPISGDFENGYGSSLADVKLTITQAFEFGLAGCSIEDTNLPSSKPYHFDEALARIKAAVEARDALNGDFVLCARADGIMNGHYDTDEAIKRLQAFEKAGADVLYVPLPENWDNLQRVIDSVKAPVNVLVAGIYRDYTYEDFASIGAARLSFGSQLARVTHQAMINAANEIFKDGDFKSFQKAASGDEVDELLEKGAR